MSTYTCVVYQISNVETIVLPFLVATEYATVPYPHISIIATPWLNHSLESLG